jgi:pimeloyl-ACP methyl ester carboxylesterase
MARRFVFWLVSGTAALAVALTVVLSAFRLASQARENVSRVDGAPPTGQFVTAADVGIYVQQSGPPTGVPVLLIHGVGAWSETWRPTIDALAQAGYRVIAIDMPPFGFSFRPPSGDYSTAAQAKRILGVLDALKIERAVLIGHSFGARATVEAAMLAPGRVRALVLVCAALGLQDPPDAGPPVIEHLLLGVPTIRNALVATFATNPLVTGALLRAFTARHEAITPERIDVYRRPLRVVGTTPAVGVWLGQFLLSDEHPASREVRQYRNLTMPALVIWGERDTITPLPQGLHLASLLVDGTLVMLPGIGHIPQLEAANDFNARLLPHLAKALGQAP